jgi:E3 ubiquitin-protein ligase RNF115/126
VDDTGEEPSRLPSRGLPDAAIDVLPTFRPTRPQECQVCMEDDISLDLWRRLPCMHAFHCHCADAWLRNHNTCPACAGVVVLEEEDAALERSLLA